MPDSNEKLNIVLKNEGNMVVARTVEDDGSTTELERLTIKPALRVLESFKSLGLKPKFDALDNGDVHETYEARKTLAIKVIRRLATTFTEASRINMERRNNGELYDNPKADEKFYEVERYLNEKISQFDAGSSKGMSMLINMVLGGKKTRTNKEGVENVIFEGMGYDIPLAGIAAVTLEDRNVSGRSLIAKALSSASLLDSQKYAGIAALLVYSTNPTHVTRLAKWDDSTKTTLWFDEADLREIKVVVDDNDVASIAESVDMFANIVDSIDISDLLA